jgi:hypothetical protein
VAKPAKVGPLTSEGAYVYTADITDSGGVGSLHLTAAAFADTPVHAADRDNFVVGNCAPPKRTVQPDGTVLQVYPMQVGEPYQTLLMTLRIYRPSGIVYNLIAYSMGSPDVRPDPRSPGTVERIGKGRDTLPLTEAQLADLGAAVADIG